MIINNIKYFIFSFALVMATSFFLAGFCKASTVIEEQTNDNNYYIEELKNLDIENNQYLYQPFLNPITNWQSISEFSADVCSTVDDEVNSPLINVYVYSSDSINNCLDPLEQKCITSIVEGTNIFYCDTGTYHRTFGWSTNNIVNNGNFCLPEEGQQKNILCGVAIESMGNPMAYPELTSGYMHIRTSGYLSTYPAGFNFNTGSSTYPLYFSLYGELNNITPPITEPCDCSISTSSNWIEIGTSAVFCGIKYSMCWAFFPDMGTIQNFATSTSMLADKFPLNTYFGLTDAVTNALDTQDTMAGSLGVPLVRTVNGHAQYYIAPVVSSSSMIRAIGQTNTTLFRNGLTWLVWIIVAGLIFLIIFMI
jgi:hypothetical protein